MDSEGRLAGKRSTPYLGTVIHVVHHPDYVAPQPRMSQYQWNKNGLIREALHAGRPDLVFPSRRKIIFVHGCFFHMHDCRYGRVTPKQNAEFWQAKRLSNVERDRRTRAALERDGWKVLEVWECQTRSPEMLEGMFRNFLA